MNTTTTREQHLAWCKTRALELCSEGDLPGALASMYSDLRKHPETAGHPAVGLGVLLQAGGFLNELQEVRKFVNDFN